MPKYHPDFGDSEGPLGFPMASQQAQQLEELLRGLPREGAYLYRKSSIPAALTQLTAGERTDVSWISHEAMDYQGDIVLASGMEDATFALNPIVTLNHDYTIPPVGLSQWRQPWRQSEQRGILAKTYYPNRPATWHDATWPPDDCLGLVQAGLLRGKSVGFLPLKVRAPTREEIDRQPTWKNARHIVERWLLLEYACCWMPVQPHAIVEAVAKGQVEPLSAAMQYALGIDVPLAFAVEAVPDWDAVRRIDWKCLVAQQVDRVIQRRRGRIA